MKLVVMAFIAFCFCGIHVMDAQTTPAEREDAREERLKILRAADQIETVQSNSEKLRIDVESLKDQVSKLQDANTSMRGEINGLKTALQKSEEARAKEREVFLSKVGEMIASSKPAPAPAPEPKKETKEPKEPASTEAQHDAEHGYYYTVEKGQTLSMIAAAYGEKGIKVTVEDIRKANKLGPKSVLKVGQKLFIPKK